MNRRQRRRDRSTAQLDTNERTRKASEEEPRMNLRWTLLIGFVGRDDSRSSLFALPDEGTVGSESDGLDSKTFDDDEGFVGGGGGALFLRRAPGELQST